MVEFQPQSGTTTALDSIAILMCYFLPLLFFHRMLVISRCPLSPIPRPHSTPYYPDSLLLLPPPGSSLRLDVARLPLFGVYSRCVISVSPGVPYLHHGCISLSPPCSPCFSSIPPQSTPDPRDLNRPSLPPPNRRTSLSEALTNGTCIRGTGKCHTRILLIQSSF